MNSTTKLNPVENVKNTRLFSLTEDQLFVLVNAEPSFMFEHLPWLVLKLRPDWVAQYHTDWMISKFPSYLIEHHLQELCIRSPMTVFQYKPEALIQYNKKWLIDHRKSWVEFNCPEIIKEISYGWSVRSTLIEKNKNYRAHFISRMFDKLFGSFLFLFKKHGKESNPFLSEEMVEMIKNIK